VPTPAAALVVAAHPDDCDMACGGTVAKWAAAGARVHLVVLTDGSKGSHDGVPAAELAAARETEQRRAGEALGLAGVAFLRHPDGELAHGPSTIAQVAEAIRTHAPEIVLSHDPWRPYEQHPDHRAAGMIAVDAVYRAGEPAFYPELTERGLGRAKPTELWLWRPLEVDHVEPLSDADFAAKWAAVRCHESQYASSFKLAPGESPDGSRFATGFAQHFAEIGARAEAPYGEEFHRIALW
jgi:LmbE family N-acetylglucosaminyl deacetylase